MAQLPSGKLPTAVLQKANADKPTETTPFLDEVKETVARLRAGKVLGVRNICTKSLKAGGQAMISGLNAVLAATLW